MQEDFQSYNQQDATAAVSKFRQMLASKANYYFDVEELSSVADYFILGHDMKNALRAVKYGLGMHPDNSSLKLKLAEIYSGHGKFFDALDILLNIEALESYNADFYLLLGEIQSAIGRDQKAIKAYEKAAQLVDEAEVTEVMLNIVYMHQSKGNVSEAIELLQNLLETAKSQDEILYELAFTYDVNGQDIESEMFFAEYVDEYPFSSTGWYLLGNAYQKVNQHHKAVEAYDFAIALYEDFSPSRFNKASSLQQLSKTKEAITEYQELLSMDLSDSIVHFHLGQCFDDLGDFNLAEEHYRLCIKEDEDYADAWYELACVLLKQDLPFDGLSHIKRALELNANNSNYWHCLACILQELEYKEETIDAFNRALELDDVDYRVYLDYTEFLFDMEMLDEADDIIHRALDRFNNHASIYIRYVAYLIKNAQLVDAKDYLNIALSHDSNCISELFEYFPEAKHYHFVNDLAHLYQEQKS